MTDPARNGESLQDLVAHLSDVLRFVFAQQREDIVVLVGDDGVNCALVSQLEPAQRWGLRLGLALRATLNRCSSK